MLNNHVYQHSVATVMPYDKPAQNLSGLKQYTFIFAYISLIGLGSAGLTCVSAVSWSQLDTGEAASLTLPCLPHMSETSPGTAVQSRLCSVRLVLQRVTLGMLLWWKPSSKFLSSFCSNHTCTFYWPNKQVNLNDPRVVTTSSVRGVKNWNYQCSHSTAVWWHNYLKIIYPVYKLLSMNYFQYDFC